MQKSIHVLHFLVEEVNACIELQYINKVIFLPLLKKIPGSLDYLAGIMNYAGKNIPVIDLAIKLQLKPKKHYSLNTPILLCSSDQYEVGLLVSKVFDLAVITQDQLQMKKDQKENNFFSATVTLDSDLVFLLDAHHILAQIDITEMNRPDRIGSQYDKEYQ